MRIGRRMSGDGLRPFAHLLRRRRPSLPPHARPANPTEPPEGWVRPWWAERQLDPNSPAHAPEPSRCRYWNRDDHVEASVLANTLGRSWTTIGLPETLDRAAIDPRGLVVWTNWSLDWWVRAGEEWVLPSRAPAVRQRLVDGMPVVETVLRVGGGDVVHRVAAARGAAIVPGDGASRSAAGHSGRDTVGQSPAVPEVFVVEITNSTSAPVAVALAARPYNLGAFEHVDAEIWEWSNAWAIDEIAVDGRVMSLNDTGRSGFGLTSVIFDRKPGDVVVGSHGTDCAAALNESRGRSAETEQAGSMPVSIRGGATSADPPSTSGHEREPISVECPQRLANAAAIFPLVAGATLRAAVPGKGLAFKWDGAHSPQLGAEVLDAVPSLGRVANGWRRRVDASCRLELPSGRLADAVLAARAAQLLSTAPCDDGRGLLGPMLWPSIYTDAQFAGDDLMQLLALVESGTPESVRDLLIRQAQAQFASGQTASMGSSVTGSTLVLAEYLLSLHPDSAFAEGISEFVTSAARWLLSTDAERREQPWTIREGLRAGFRLLMRLGAERAADALARSASALRDTLRVDAGGRPEASAFYLDRQGRVPWTAPRRGASEASVSQRWEWVSHDTGLWIHAAVPWAPPLPFVTAEPSGATPEDLVLDTAASCGYDIVATALLAFAEARPVPARAFRRLEALVSVASPTLNWPTFMHPRLRTGTNGTGHDLQAGGLFVRTLLRLLVDVPDDGGPNSEERPKLRLAAHWSAAWLGQPVEVHDVPTRIGTVSWAVRWHGERPALLWDVVPHDPDGQAPSVTAPGLDPAFTSTQWRGENLLAPMPAP
ncbi:hypothetical protein [Candidatus Poriferisodalis sp.]|uniref:hypothetical protein n=1 Tax=Candidatus Poriferisodalis sp. TaxID=3101277 RepID=UPI003B5AF864